MNTNTDKTDINKKVPILLLKTKSSPNDAYEEQFSQVKGGLSFAPTFVPVLEHQLQDDGMKVVRKLLEKTEIGRSEKSKYGGLIFTSQRAVEAFAKLVDEGKDDDTWPHLQDVPIYTVGPATSRALRVIRQTPPLTIFGSDTGNGKALADYILDHYGEWYQGSKVKPPLLFMVGEQRRDIIPKTLMDSTLDQNRRIQVDELIVYGTGVMKSFEQDFMNLLLETRDMDIRWIIVFSPTGCEAMLRALGLFDSESGKARQRVERKKSNTYFATIGPTTRDHLKEMFGFDPDVCAAIPSPEGVEDGIRKFMQDRG